MSSWEELTQVTQSWLTVWQKGVAPCFPHQVGSSLFHSGLCHPFTYCLEGGKVLGFTGRWTQPDDALRGWQIERTNTGLVWTEKTLFLVNLSFRKATKPLLKGQE